jgi:hypothetical protein
MRPICELVHISGVRPVVGLRLTDLTSIDPPGGPSMSLTSDIVNESRAARRLRFLAPWISLLALLALIITPGIIAQLP